MRRLFKILLWSLLVLFLLRIFVFQPCKVENFTMSSTLLPGDRILVNKISTGARFPNSILGLPGPDRAYFDLFRIPYFRLPGFRDFKRNDIVVFNDPRVSDEAPDRTPLKISRLVAMPGDTVSILDKVLYINRQEVPNPKASRFLYRVITNGEQVPVEFLTEFNVEEPELIADIGIFDFLLDSIALEAIEKLPMVKNVRLRKQFIGDSSRGYFPNSGFFFWNADQFGPVIVPTKGLTVDIHLKNIDLFREVIDIYESNELQVDFSGITINGVKTDSYTFMNDYYFVLDDNRGKPEDSRILGFVPESHLLGTSRRILFSGKSKYEYIDASRLRRTLKKFE